MTRAAHGALLLFMAMFVSAATSAPGWAQAVTTSQPTDLVDPSALEPEFEKSVAKAHIELIQADNKARLDHRIALMKHDEQIFAWQRWASEVLLWVVVAVVACGLAFSGYQLIVVMEMARHRIRRQQATAQTNPEVKDGDGTPSTASQIAISAGRLEVTSSVVGVTVLVISIAFLYLFVREVYTITPLSAPATAKPPIVEETTTAQK
jgi:hypothetical protein